MPSEGTKIEIKYLMYKGKFLVINGRKIKEKSIYTYKDGTTSEFNYI